MPQDRFEKVPAGQKADIYVISTCSVTDAADRKCRQAIRKFIHQSPDAFIAVVGCYSQLRPDEISAIPGVDLVLGINEKYDLAEYIAGHSKGQKTEIHSCELSGKDIFRHSFSAGDRTRSFLKVQDGCDYKCSYCTVPLARGMSRNPDIKSLVKEAESIANKGVREIVLTGVNIGDFGRSTGESFNDLLAEITRTDGIDRIRISSIEPNLLNDELIEMALCNRKILPHFHIPLQSGNNKILGLMRRRYLREVFAERVSRIKEKLPFAGIGADVIVGFPGETDTDFEDTWSFLKDLPLSYLHVFTYSERPGTDARNLPGKVSRRVSEERSKKLISLSDLKKQEFFNLNKGRLENVLFERKRTNGMIDGFTGNYIKVEHPWMPELTGQIKKVKLTGASAHGKMSVEIVD